eukprot:58007-Alexandrium_andersonii.AAC.1
MCIRDRWAAPPCVIKDRSGNRLLLGTAIGQYGDRHSPGLQKLNRVNKNCHDRSTRGHPRRQRPVPPLAVPAAGFRGALVGYETPRGGRR